MGTPAGFDGKDTGRGQCFVLDKKLLILAGEDVVCDGGYMRNYISLGWRSRKGSTHQCYIPPEAYGTERGSGRSFLILQDYFMVSASPL